MKLGPRHRSLVDGELVAQGEILESELAVAAAQEGEEANEVEQDGDHRARILSGSEPTDQPLARRTQVLAKDWLALARGLNREYIDAEGRAVSHVTDETTNRALWKHYRTVMTEA